MIEYITFKLSTGEVSFADKNKKIIKRLDHALKNDWNTVREEARRDNEKESQAIAQSKERVLF